MVIFNSYVKLPEGNHSISFYLPFCSVANSTSCSPGRQRCPWHLRLVSTRCWHPGSRPRLQSRSQDFPTKPPFFRWGFPIAIHCHGWLMFIGWEIIYLKSPERWFPKINEFTNLRWDFTWSSPMFKRSKHKNLGNFQTPVESWGPQRFTNIRDV